MSMKQFFDLLHTVELFQGITTEELPAMLSCLGAQTSAYQKGQTLLSAGSRPEHIGIVLSGQLQVIKDDAEGNHTLLAALAPADIFAEALCCAGVEESPIAVVAGLDSTVLLLKFPHMLRTCSSSCVFHQKLIENMLGIIAQKNIYLQNRIELIRIKSIRAKVLSYLEPFASAHGSSFSIPLSRGEMADYLCVDRSALSHELIRMKRDGLIDYHKNTFVVVR